MRQDKDGARKRLDATDPTDTPFQRFLRVARRVVNISKSDAEKRDRERKASKERT